MPRTTAIENPSTSDWLLMTSASQKWRSVSSVKKPITVSLKRGINRLRAWEAYTSQAAANSAKVRTRYVVCDAATLCAIALLATELTKDLLKTREGRGGATGHPRINA